MKRADNAIQMQRKREMRRILGLPRSGGKGGKHKSSFETGEFIAVDGEGFNTGELLTFTVGDGNSEYKGYKHEYALLSASDGSEIYNPTGRLETKQCLDFLLAIKQNNPRAIPVCFGASYDMTQMLAFGLERWQVAELLNGEDETDPFEKPVLDVTLSDENGTHDYRLEIRPRKKLSIWRFEHGAEKYLKHVTKSGKATWKLNTESSVTLWDVWGFFQGTFVKAMAEYLPDDPDRLMIEREKGNRSIFRRDEIDTIRRYNQAELRCLVAMMNKVRDAIGALHLTVSRWDGAGAIAASLLAANGVKDHMPPPDTTPPAVFDAMRRAYSGGHIEAIKLGYHNGKIHHYDLNSAYPHHFRMLPSLAAGSWQHLETSDIARVPPGFTLVHVAYQFRGGMPFYPLFHRTRHGSILYPQEGEGWFWFEEFITAVRFVETFGARRFDVSECWHWQSNSNAAPFTWIEQTYAMRQQLVAESKRTKTPDGREMMLKLGMNSCYGKTAQQVGARMVSGVVQPPPYFSMAWAGAVTSGCRAQLMAGAINAPDAIVSFATDGLFSLEPLPLDCPREKILGAWEYKQHDGMTIVMPGVYWLHDGERTRHYSRGFKASEISDVGKVHRGWRERRDEIRIGASRMVTLGSAIMSDTFWTMRGMFVESERVLKLNGHTSKRAPVPMSRATPHLGLVATVPADNRVDELDPADRLSAPYPVVWLDMVANDMDAPDSDAAFLADREAGFLA